MTELVLHAARLGLAVSLVACSQGSAPVRDARTAQLQDLLQLRHFVALDRAYSDAQRAQALMLIGESEARAGSWAAAEFDLQVERVVALADNGHSSVWRTDRSARMNRIPARLLLLADGVFVVRAKGEALPGLGKRIEAIDGVPIAEILRRLRVYSGGPNNLRDYEDVSLLESPQLLHAAGIAQSEQEMTLLFSDNEKHTKTLKLSALTPPQNDARVAPLRYLAALPTIEEGPEWRSAFQASRPPLWLEEPDRAFRLVPLPDVRSVYLQLKTNADAEDGERLSVFLSQTRQSLANNPPQNLVLDMRFNGGGDYTKTASFMTDLPTMIPKDGRIFIITHAATFSAGITSVGFVKQVSPQQTMIVGEPIGDRLIFYGDRGISSCPIPRSA